MKANKIKVEEMGGMRRGGRKREKRGRGLTGEYHQSTFSLLLNPSGLIQLRFLPLWL
jgi:hypothetical protein